MISLYKHRYKATGRSVLRKTRFPFGSRRDVALSLACKPLVWDGAKVRIRQAIEVEEVPDAPRGYLGRSGPGPDRGRFGRGDSPGEAAPLARAAPGQRRRYATLGGSSRRRIPGLPRLPKASSVREALCLARQPRRRQGPGREGQRLWTRDRIEDPERDPPRSRQKGLSVDLHS
jgi:hypothetical protein